jgi:hypothetical protein
LVDHPVNLQHGWPGPYLAINVPSLSLSIAIAMVNHAVNTAWQIQHCRPSPYLATNGPSLSLSIAIAMVDHFVNTGW